MTGVLDHPVGFGSIKDIHLNQHIFLSQVPDAAGRAPNAREIARAVSCG